MSEHRAKEDGRQGDQNEEKEEELEEGRAPGAKKSKLHSELQRIYTSAEDPGSYGGIERLFRRAKELGIEGVSRKSVREYLAGEASYSLHRPARRHFHRNHTYVQGIDDQWQADLVDMQTLSRSNKGKKYLLTCIDVFSKYAWVIPLPSKSSAAMIAAFDQLFEVEAGGRKPKKLHTDKGKEFLNSEVQRLLANKYKIKHFSSFSDQKAAICERFNRTLKSRMWRYFSAHQTNHYLDVLPRLLISYNNTHHRSIGCSPMQASNPENEEKVRKILYKDRNSVGKRGRNGVIKSRKTHTPALPPPPAGAAAAAAEERATSLPNSPLESNHEAAETPTTNIIHHQGDEKDEENNQFQSLMTVGSRVRISRVKGNFEKGYLPNWSEEDFRIREIINRPSDRPVYKLEDRSGEPIEGIWYSEELQPITENRYLVERIIRKRTAVPKEGEGPPTTPTTTECLVKWRGWPAKFNTWVPESDLTRISEENSGIRRKTRKENLSK